MLALGTHPKLWERGGNLYHGFQRARISHLGLILCPLEDQAHLCGEVTRQQQGDGGEGEEKGKGIRETLVNSV